MKNGFTLVELAIVIVIIGLLVGGIFQGQELIRQSKIRTLTKNIESYSAAILLFRDKYKYPPGDMPRAYDFFAATGCTDEMVTIAATNGCNGDGNGEIGDAGFPIEIYKAWQFLGYAGYIKGNYTGIPVASAPYNPTADTSPNGVFENTLVDFRSTNAQNWSNGGLVANSFSVGARNLTASNAVSTSGAAGRFLTPEEAMNFDSKIDDGFPGRGKVRSRPSMVQSGCATTSDSQTAVYNTTNSTIRCSMFIEIGLQ